VGVPVLPLELSLTVAVNVTDCPNTIKGAEETTVVVVLALFTVWFSAVDVLVVKFESPLYTAVIESLVPVGSALVVHVAVSGEVPLSACELHPDIDVPPTLKLTEPLGMPDPLPVTVTVAVNVTDWPNTEGFVPEVTVVDVPA
jgi:hypothetical protein